MTSEWPEWLAELASEGKLLPEAIVPFAMRGYAWGMSVSVAGDFTGYQLIGRVKIAPDASNNIAVMDAFGPVFFEGNTLWQMSLTEEVTRDFPPDPSGVRVQKHPMLLILVPPAPAKPYPLGGGMFTLIGAL